VKFKNTCEKGITNKGTKNFFFKEIFDFRCSIERKSHAKGDRYIPICCMFNQNNLSWFEETDNSIAYPKVQIIAIPIRNIKGFLPGVFSEKYAIIKIIVTMEKDKNRIDS
jgi:hypothetical protein